MSISQALRHRAARTVFTSLILAVGALGILGSSTQTAHANASVFTQDFTRCLVSSVSADDKVSLIRWVTGAMAQHPALQDLTSVAPEDNAKLNKKMAGLVQRLLLDDCQKEAKNVAAYDQAGFFQSFSVLGTVAMSEIMANPEVAKAIEAYANYLDEEKINNTLGLPETAGQDSSGKIYTESKIKQKAQ